MKYDFNKNINENRNIDLLDAKRLIITGQYSRFKRLIQENPEVIPYITNFLKERNLSIEDFIPIEQNNDNTFTPMPTPEMQAAADIAFNRKMSKCDNGVGNEEITDIEQQNTQKSTEQEKPTNKINKLVHSINNNEFRSSLNDIINIHNQIVDMYINTLYDDEWDEYTIEKFDSLLDEYNKKIEYIKTNISKIEWNSEENKSQFKKYFKEVINADARAWNRVQVRNSNYLRYRTNRRSIISQIADILGGVKNSKDANYQDIFKYFNERCADIQLYDNSDKTDKKDVLSKWLKPHLNRVMDEMKDRGIFIGSIDSVDISKVFRIYVKCRKMAYAIFNLMTSNSEFNGYDKWHNQFINYCDANLNDKQMEQLMNAVESEGKFENVDDYQNIMDEESWEKKGFNESMSFDFNKNINESWLDDSLEYYHSHKDRYNKSKIDKIDAIPTNANQCRVQCDGNYVYANATFYPGDIIEICPTKNIDKSALYSKDMRDSVFEVVPNEKWVLPFGYCRYYLHDVDIEQQNCTYIWDPIKNVIVIKAINKIPKYSKLFLKFIV